MGKIEAFGIKIDNLTMEEVLGKIGQFLKHPKSAPSPAGLRSRSKIEDPRLWSGQCECAHPNNHQHYVVLPYSEFVVRAQKDEEFKKILNKADLCLCEGRGLYFTLKFLGLPIKEEVNGVELIYNTCSQFPISNFQSNPKSQILNPKIFLLGGTDKVVKKTADRLGDSVVGFEHGYQDLDSPRHGNGRGKIIEKINKAKPEILLVNLGSPKQEKWIYENLKKMPSVKVAIGVGGAFDFISGRIKRAPKFVQKIGLEWLWRLILQPWRIKRIYNGVVKFSWLVLKEKLQY